MFISVPFIEGGLYIVYTDYCRLKVSGGRMYSDPLYFMCGLKVGVAYKLMKG